MTMTRPRQYEFGDLETLMALMTGDEKHGPAATSTLDVLWVLYDRVLNIDPIDPRAPGRDRFLLSKGHGPVAFYAVLAAKGFIGRELLPGFGGFDSPLGHHPDRVLLPGVEIGSGSLGHGLGLAVGTALGLRALGLDRPRVFTLLGDAELDEGSNHEAIAFAGAIGLDNLHAGAVLVSWGASYDMSSMGRTHQAPGDVALLDTLDGWTIHVPGHPDEAELLLRRAAAGDGRVYLRLSAETNPEPHALTPGRFEVVRAGQAGTVIAVGPMLAPVLNAVSDLDVTVLYAVTVRPFDAATLRQAVGASASTDVVLAEPYLAGTSSREVGEALLDVPHRLLGLGVGRAELRRYGTPAEHAAAHGLDAASLRKRISGFLR